MPDIGYGTFGFNLYNEADVAQYIQVTAWMRQSGLDLTHELPARTVKGIKFDFKEIVAHAAVEQQY